jgi:uncharacterized membrane protein
MGLLGGIFGFVIVAGLLALITLGTIWAVRHTTRSPRTAAGPDEALDLVRRRFAAGEITAAEYEEIRDRLRS